MFNLQGSEIVIVLLLALVVLGPEKLPDAMRKLGEFYAELKKMSSGFQSEFRAAIDEPMREVRDTANALRDSADLTKLQNGEREEKPKSAEMGPAADAGTTPAEAVSDFDRPGGDGSPDEPGLAADSKPAPFSGQSSAAPRPPSEVGEADSTVDVDEPSSTDAASADDGASEAMADGSSDEPGLAADSKPAPFSGQSSAAPRPPAMPDAGTAPFTDAPRDGVDTASTDHDGSEVAERQLGADDATRRAR